MKVSSGLNRTNRLVFVLRPTNWRAPYNSYRKPFPFFDCSHIYKEISTPGTSNYVKSDAFCKKATSKSAKIASTNRSETSRHWSNSTTRHHFCFILDYFLIIYLTNSPQKLSGNNSEDDGKHQIDKPTTTQNNTFLFIVCSCRIFQVLRAMGQISPLLSMIWPKINCFEMFSAQKLRSNPAGRLSIISTVAHRLQLQCLRCVLGSGPSFTQYIHVPSIQFDP